MNGQPEYTQKHANLFLSLQKTNTFTTTAIGKGDTGIVTDFSTGRRSDSVLTEVGRPRRGWSKRTQFLIAFGVVFVVILVICIFLGVFLGKNGSGDSSAGKFEVCKIQLSCTPDRVFRNVYPFQQSFSR